MKVDTFDFDLPRACIAQRPMTPRDAARLLVVGDELRDARVSDLPRHLSPGDLLVFNDTKVIPARLAGRRGAAKVEVTLHKAADAATWRAFARPARRLKKGDRIEFAPGFVAEVETKGEAGEVTLSFEYGSADLEAALERFGAMPLPPYIKRPNLADWRDPGDYQTMFARVPGAVAAPTAGLHFTPGLLDGLDARGVERIALTLHVGAGTFLPVKVEDVADHKMHAEWGEITALAAAAVNAARARGNQVVAVGSTALRLLEAATDAAGRLRPFAGETDIFITPGFRFRTVDRLLTNFHLPRSTLFMLVSAFAGTRR
ncbi:MAG: tRNA preQ1(34) S-adenosylmethionine ribosyltransferase-isomerase QueA, partial [Rhodospirillales bacterium]|nr:tRNA preQ1(34) S-adenosylmethionine ribosyltransferase-isomerase QueA [Rhodospirillales bacterium]